MFVGSDRCSVRIDRVLESALMLQIGQVWCLRENMEDNNPELCRQFSKLWSVWDNILTLDKTCWKLSCWWVWFVRLTELRHKKHDITRVVFVFWKYLEYSLLVRKSWKSWKNLGFQLAMLEVLGLSKYLPQLLQVPSLVGFWILFESYMGPATPGKDPFGPAWLAGHDALGNNGAAVEAETWQSTPKTERKAFKRSKASSKSFEQKGWVGRRTFKPITWRKHTLKDIQLDFPVCLQSHSHQERHLSKNLQARHWYAAKHSHCARLAEFMANIVKPNRPQKHPK